MYLETVTSKGKRRLLYGNETWTMANTFDRNQARTKRRDPGYEVDIN